MLSKAWRAQRTLNKKRSWVAAGIATASALLVGGLVAVATGGAEEGETPTPTENVVPAGTPQY
jgi:hypothetical protein